MLDDTKVDRPYLSASETRGSVVKLSMDSLADTSTKEGVSLNFGFEEYAGAEGLDFDNDAYSTTSNINLAGPSDSIELFGDEITKEIEKNDSWSKGFAEWLNTKKSNDIDTSDEDILKKKKVNGFGKLDENVLLPFDDELEAEHFGGKGGSCTDWSSRMDLDSSSKQNSNIKILSESGYSDFAQYHESIPIESIDLNANLIQKERIQKRLYGKQNSNKKGTELSVIQKLKNEYHYNEGLATDGRVYAGQQWGYEDADPNAVPFGKNAKSEYFKKMNRGKRARENTDNMDEEGNRVGVVESEQAYQKLMEARKKSKACIIVEDPEELGIDAEFLIAKNVEKMKKRNIYKRVYQVDLLKIQDGVSKVGTKTYFNIPESKDYVTAQASSGKKLYFTRFEANLPSIMGGVPGNRDSLNWTNPRINQIVLNIEQKMDREQLNRNIELSRNVDPLRSSMESSKNAIYTKVPSQPQKAKVMGQLWVDKYKPKTFFDLVGNEKINRMVLSWVKHWDYCVFNRDNPAHLQMDYYRPGRTRFSSKKGGMGFSKSNDMRGDEANQPIDTLKRPFKKILLLSGPPGVGKTTLAHIVARQAGYKPVEINASDDRTAAKAKNMILSATGIKSITENQAPQLLIIDEIDGVSWSKAGDEDFISILVKLATIENHQSSKKGSEDIDRLDQNQGKRQQKKASNAGLLRPIICICNDLYTPALLPLREVAQSIQIYPPPELATTKYLSWVCLNENLKLDNWTISKLVKRSRGDLRSCLNSLQFISVGGSNQKELLLGDKDHHASLFSAWEAIFTIQNSQSQQYDNSTSTRDAKSHLIKLLESNGEFDKLMQGCFENYLKLGVRDLTHDKFSSLLHDWIYFYDTLNLFLVSNPSNTFDLWQYISYPFVAINQACGSSLGLINRNFVFPKSEMLAQNMARAFVSTVDRFFNECPVQSTRLTYSPVNYSVQLAYYLNLILSPRLTGGNLALYTNEMKQTLNHLIKVMMSFNLRFVQNRINETTFVFDLSPPIDKLTRYSTVSKVQATPLKYQVKMLANHQLELAYLKRHSIQKSQQHITDGAEKMNSISSDLLNTNRNSQSLQLKIHSTKQSSVKKNTNSGSKLPLLGKEVKATENKNPNEPQAQKKFTSMLSFFSVKPVAKTQKGSNIALSKKDDDVDSELQNIPKKDITKLPEFWFSFNEGYSNAVKKPVIIKELL